MRVKLQEMLKRLGVDHDLQPYQTVPFDYFDKSRGIDFMAGVSMSGDRKTVEAEIQLITYSEDSDEPHFEQVFMMQAHLDGTGGRYISKDVDTYTVDVLRIMGQPNIAGKKFDWFEKGCRFFKSCVSHIRKGIVPDFKLIYKSAFNEEWMGGDGSSAMGGRGSRNFKLNDKRPPPKAAKSPPKPLGGRM